MRPVRNVFQKLSRTEQRREGVVAYLCCHPFTKHMGQENTTCTLLTLGNCRWHAMNIVCVRRLFLDIHLQPMNASLYVLYSK